MASFLSALNPIPTFPAYTGPFQVGSVDYEVPISELTPEEKRPEAEISTVQFRVFYPCEKVSSKPKPVRWIPEPQRGYLDGYAKFGGAGKFISSILSSAPSIFNYITIPVHRDAPLHKPNSNTGKWPVLVFSHGLGGTRHMYSHLLGSLASHGMVCIAPEHRDGSAPVSFIESNISSGKATKETTRVDYIRVSHTASPEVEDTRNNQLRIRLWELAQIHDAIHKLDRGMLDQYAKGSPSAKSPLARSSIFQNSLEIHKPGSIVWGGHSFGAATTIQFIKSVFYNSTAEDPSPKPGLYITPQSSPLKGQITPKTPVILLDLWCLPVEAMSTQSLFQKPMPTYAPSGPQGSNLLSVCSEQFFKWNVNFKMTLRIISSNPADEKPKSLASGPHLFYAATSAHLNQSDFGVLFPWITKRAFKAEEPERTLRLNVRAILQVLRDSDIHVAPTSQEDMEMTSSSPNSQTGGDSDILATDGRIRAWIPLGLSDGDTALSSSSSQQTIDLQGKADPFDAVVQEEVMETQNSKVKA